MWGAKIRPTLPVPFIQSSNACLTIIDGLSAIWRLLCQCNVVGIFIASGYRAHPLRNGRDAPGVINAMTGSESGYALWGVVWDGGARDLFKPTVGLNGVADKSRGV